MQPGRGDLQAPPASTGPDPSGAVRTMPHSAKDVLAGIVFVVIGLGFTVVAMTYGIGSANQMGPGSFPLVLGLILVGLGAFIGARGLADGEAGPIGSIPWRAVALVVGAVIVFGLTVRSLGLARSTVVTPLMFEYGLMERARSDRKHIVLPEGSDDRILRAAASVLAMAAPIPLVPPVTRAVRPPRGALAAVESAGEGEAMDDMLQF